MKKLAAITLLFVTLFLLTQCNHAQDGERHHMMNDGQMSQMMQNPEQRQAMMAQMAENPEMRNEFMSHMRLTMMSSENDQMLDRMEEIMNDPEQRDRMRSHMQEMMVMLDSDSFDRQQMREMI